MRTRKQCLRQRMEENDERRAPPVDSEGALFSGREGKGFAGTPSPTFRQRPTIRCKNVLFFFLCPTTHAWATTQTTQPAPYRSAETGACCMTGR